MDLSLVQASNKRKSSKGIDDERPKKKAKVKEIKSYSVRFVHVIIDWGQIENFTIDMMRGVKANSQFMSFILPQERSVHTGEWEWVVGNEYSHLFQNFCVKTKIQSYLQTKLREFNDFTQFSGRPLPYWYNANNTAGITGIPHLQEIRDMLFNCLRNNFSETPNCAVTAAYQPKPDEPRAAKNCILMTKLMSKIGEGELGKRDNLGFRPVRDPLMVNRTPGEATGTATYDDRSCRGNVVKFNDCAVYFRMEIDLAANKFVPCHYDFPDFFAGLFTGQTKIERYTGEVFALDAGAAPVGPEQEDDVDPAEL